MYDSSRLWHRRRVSPRYDLAAISHARPHAQLVTYYCRRQAWAGFTAATVGQPALVSAVLLLPPVKTHLLHHTSFIPVWFKFIS